MDTEYRELEENITELFVDLNVMIRCENTWRQNQLDKIDCSLQEIAALTKDKKVSRTILKNISYTYMLIISVFTLAKDEKKEGLKNLIIAFEKSVIDFLKENGSGGTENEKNQRLVSLLELNTVQQETYDLLNLIRSESINESFISKSLAYVLFSYQRELFWRSSFFEKPYKSWEFLSNEDVEFVRFLKTSEYIEDIFEKNVRL